MVQQLPLLPQKEFLSKYNIPHEKFEKTGLTWEELNDIYSDYSSRYEELDRAAFPLFNALIKFDNVHSVRYRIKDPEHVIEKIIRKKIRYPKRVIINENYLKEITDLIGLRAIHLFKDDWLSIHQAIIDKWHQKEMPTYYFRAGDQIGSKDQFKNIGCKTALHPRHYRSVHYVIKTTPAKQEYFAEIQVRTLFEEGWSEIDHRVGYPYSVDNEVQNDFLSILNRLAGSADEMGTFIKNLKPSMAAIKRKAEEDERQMEEVKSDIDSNEKLSPPEKQSLKGKLPKLGESELSKVIRLASEATGSMPKFADLGKSNLIFTPEVLAAIKANGVGYGMAMSKILEDFKNVGLI